MGAVVAVHQPQYLPWAGYFDKVAGADVFVFLDDTQYKVREWQNRNRIRTPDGWQWLGVPVLKSFKSSILDVRVDNTQDWAGDHIKSLQHNYGRARYFSDCMSCLEPVLRHRWEFLCALNMKLIEEISGILGVKRLFVRSSSLGFSETGTDHLVAICKALGAGTYLSGAGGHGYVEAEKFEGAGIRVTYQEFETARYRQLHGEFIANLSIIDMLFNCGKESAEILIGSGGGVR